MAWRNLWRNPRRSLLTLAAIAFATLLLIFMLSWQLGSYATMINSAVRNHTGHLQIQAAGYNEKQEIRLVVEHPQKIKSLLERTPGVKAWTFRSRAFALAASEKRTYGAMVIGIDPEREKTVSRLPGLIRQGNYFSATDDERSLLGSLLAKNLRVGVGGVVTLLGQGRDGSTAATVVTAEGIFRSGQDELDRGVLYLPLATFDETFYMNGAVHAAVILADSLEAIPRIKKSLRAALASGAYGSNLVVLDWTELMPGLLQSIQMDLISGFIFYLILIVVVAFSILNTFLMVIFERTREFGIILAIGVSPGRLCRLLLTESLMLTGLGILGGMLLGCLVTAFFEAHGIAFSGTGELLSKFGLPERMYPQLSWLSIGVGSGIVLVITVLTAIFPLRRVWRLRPVPAMAAQGR
jgi:putative ABC transport system permease protein